MFKFCPFVNNVPNGHPRTANICNNITCIDVISGVARIFCGGVLFTSKRNGLILYRIHVNPERSCGGTNGEPPSEASQLRKGGPGVLPRKI